MENEETANITNLRGNASDFNTAIAKTGPFTRDFMGGVHEDSRTHDYLDA